MVASNRFATAVTILHCMLSCAQELLPTTRMNKMTRTITAATMCGVLALPLAAQDNDSKNNETENSSKPASKMKREQIIEAQVLLDRAGFSPGEIDGVWGRNGEEITKLFQEAAGLPTSGEIDEATSGALVQLAGGEAALINYTLTEQDVSGPFIEKMPEKMEEKAQLPHLGYTKPVEAIAEKFHLEPELLEKMNPDAKFASGEVIKVANVEPAAIGPDGKALKVETEKKSEEKNQQKDRDKSPDEDKKGKKNDEDSGDKDNRSASKKSDENTAEGAASSDRETTATELAAVDSATSSPTAGAVGGIELNREPQGDLTITVTKSTSILVAKDETGKPIFAAPVTTGSEHDPLPIGEWKVTGTEYNPPFNYNPDLFWDADKVGKTKAKLPPGANNPVGVAWIDISKEHYGLHGTPEPGTVGHTESHGCVRLTNWNVLRLAKLAKSGTKVVFQE